MATTGEDSALRVLRVTDVVKESCQMLMPIRGYADMPLVSLENAVEPLVPFLPDVQSFAYAAKRRCKNPPADGLTLDQSASIMLYTMTWQPIDKCLYFALSTTLRLEDREKLLPWFLYLKLFLTALQRLPSKHCTVYRGVKLDLSTQYQKDDTIIWWGFSSCTATIAVLQSNLFLGKTGDRTIFMIDCDSGKDIQKHSYYPSEDEILLPAATELKVRSVLHQDHGLYLIQLQEIKSPFPLLQPVSVLPLSTSSSQPSSVSTHQASSLNPKKLSTPLVRTAAFPATQSPGKRRFFC